MTNVEKIGIMQRFEHGKYIQQKAINNGTKWTDVSMPTWNFAKYEYREKPNENNLIAGHCKDLGFLKIEAKLFHQINGAIHVRLGDSTQGIKNILPEGFEIEVKLLINQKSKLRKVI